MRSGMDEMRVSPAEEDTIGSEMDWTAADLLAAARSRGLVVYGTGYVANMFRIVLEARGSWDCVRTCIVTEAPESGELFHGVAVERAAAWASRRVDAAESEGNRPDPLVCLAVHGAILPQIHEHVSQLDLGDAVWVYPLIHELAFGPALEQGRNLELRELLTAQPVEWHWIAARACAFERDEATRALGESAYVKCMALHCGEQTARKRLQQARALAADIERDGFDPTSRIRIDSRLRIIDGLHRVALAWLRGEQHISVDVHEADDVYDRLFTDDNKLTHPALGKAGLAGEELSLLERIQCEILSGDIGQGRGLEAGSATTPAISVIIPVYNVADYIDECLESVTGQSFADFEVLLIDDGSTDGSGEKCDRWAGADTRIRAIHQPNSGVSAARNRGIEESRGTYLAFVDSDDWLDERYLEKLHARAVETQADFVECDIWRYSNRSGSKIWRHCGQSMGVPYTLAEHMKYGPTASYKSMSRRSLWIDSNVRFPPCAFESPAIYALVLALANKVEYLPEPLYYYRRFRANSLVESGYEHRDGSVNNTLGVEAMGYLVGQFRERGLYERYADELPGIVLYRLNDILAMQYHRKGACDFAEMVANYRAFVDRALLQAENRPYLTWGGYNLNKVCQHMDMLHDPSCRFNFSSLISLARPAGVRCEVVHPNRYRQMMVQREVDQAFWDVLDEQQPAFIVMDLLEERFDIVEWEGRYLTASDAWEGARLQGAAPSRIIPRESDECEELFRESLRAIAIRLNSAYPNLRIIMVENYLAEEIGDVRGRSLFPEIESIRSINKYLARLYDIACRELPNVVRVPAYRLEDYFTDEHYEYGAVPSHLNAIVNRRVGGLIQEEVGRL